MSRDTSTKPDSEFKYRIVSGYGYLVNGHRLMWHSIECSTGRNAKYAKRTNYSPEEHRRVYKERRGYEPYYRDHMAKCCLGKQSASRESSPLFTTKQAEQLLRDAHTAGLLAGNDATPTPMTVGTPTTPLGNQIDYTKRTYYVSEGVCGFAWVVIRPGNCSLARQAVKLGLAHTNYGGGVSVWVNDHGQSLERKQKHAQAYAKVLWEHGINASSESRID